MTDNTTKQEPTQGANPHDYGWVCRICDTYYPEMDQAANCHADEKERRRKERAALALAGDA